MTLIACELDAAPNSCYAVSLIHGHILKKGLKEFRMPTMKEKDEHVQTKDFHLLSINSTFLNKLFMWTQLHIRSKVIDFLWKNTLAIVLTRISISIYKVCSWNLYVKYIPHDVHCKTFNRCVFLKWICISQK